MRVNGFVILVLCVAFLVLFAGCSGEVPTKVEEKATPPPTPTPTLTQTPTPKQTVTYTYTPTVPSPTPTPTPTPTPYILKLSLGETAKTSRLRVTVNAIKADVVAGDYGNIWADKNKILIIALARFENVGKDKEYASVSDFSLADNTGRRYNPEIWSSGSGYLYPSEFRDLVLGFQVPKETSKVAIKYDFGGLFEVKLASWESNLNDIKFMSPDVKIVGGDVKARSYYGDYLIEKVIVKVKNEGDLSIRLMSAEVKYGAEDWRTLDFYINEVIEPNEEKTIEMSEFKTFKTAPSIMVRFVDDEHIIAEGWIRR